MGRAKEPWNNLRWTREPEACEHPQDFWRRTRDRAGLRWLCLQCGQYWKRFTKEEFERWKALEETATKVREDAVLAQQRLAEAQSKGYSPSSAPVKAYYTTPPPNSSPTRTESLLNEDEEPTLESLKKFPPKVHPEFYECFSEKAMKSAQKKFLIALTEQAAAIEDSME